MATTSVKLQMKFGTMSGTKTWSFSGVQGSPNANDVKTLANVMIANGSVYKYPPLTFDEAVVVQTTKTSIDIS